MKTPNPKRTSSRPPDWKLPDGLAPGTWDYVHSDSIANEYEPFLAQTPLAKLDLAWLTELLPSATQQAHAATKRDPVVADLGAGTGRTQPVLAQLGYRLLAIDLSQAMLRHVPKTTPPSDPHSAWRIRANIVQLDGLADQSVDHCACLFSTLGMVRGRAARRRALAHAFRILRPGGRLVLHVHNLWAALQDPGGLQHLAKSWWAARRSPTADFGDRVYAYRGLPNMFLHSFTARELRADLRHAAFQIRDWRRLNLRGDASLTRGWWLPNLRAGGFIVVAQRAPDTGL